jgi:ADP-heptose:LPS heptosyltransferase/glycosyltransferase involved in cell wall biosynthesis
MKILVSKPDALGDQVLASAFVQGLRRRWPDARIVWHVRSGMEVIASLLEDTTVFRANTDADPALEAQRLWNEVTAPIVVVPYAIHPYTDWSPDLEGRYAWWGKFLCQTAWDIAVAPVVNRTGLSDFTVTASRAPQRFGFSANGACQPMLEAAFTHLPEKKASFTREVPSSLQTSEWLQLERLLAIVTGNTALLPPALRITADAHSTAAASVDESSRVVLLAPGVGANTQRAWPMTNFIQLASDLAARGHDVRWIEGPHDAAYFEGHAETAFKHRLRFGADQVDLLAALLARAALVVCNDTAYVHLAAALGTPTVAIFGAGQKDRFVPRFGRVHVLQGDPVCRGCQWQCAFTRQLCVQDVPYAAVLAGVSAQLAEVRTAHERLVLPLPFEPAPVDALDEIGRVRDWYQEELDRLRWDGWARLQIINDVIERLKARDQRIAELAHEPDQVARRVSGGIETSLSASPPENPCAHAQSHAPLSRSSLREQRDLRSFPSQFPCAHAQSHDGTCTQRVTTPLRPKLSIIIPMGRPERADGTLLSLARQTLRPAQWEVVTVGVGASQLLAKYPQLPLVPVDLVHNVLPPRTRAEGVARASGEWYLFVDDDVQLAPDFFEMLARILAVPPSPEAPPAQPIGAIGVRLPGGRGTYVEHLTDISNFWSQQSPIRAVPHTVWFLYSAAIVVNAEAYHKSGGFNVELPNGEDVDLTQRIKAAGYLLAYEPSLVAYHHHGRDSLFRMWRYFWKNGNAARYFFAGFGGVCCYSLRTVLTRAWGDIKMNRNFQKTQGVRLGLRLPWVALNYLIVESSLEWHWQEYLWKAKRYHDLPARTISDQNTAKAFVAFEQRQRLRGLARYVLAMLQSLTDPVRR